MPLRNRFILFFLMAAAIPTSLGATTSFIWAKAIFDNQIKTSLESVAEIQKGKVQDSMDRYIERISFFSTNEQIGEGLAEYKETGDTSYLESTRNIIFNIVSLRPDIGHVSVVDLSGNVLVSTNPFDSGKGFDKSSFFDEDKIYTSALQDLYSADDGGLNILFTAPLFFEDKIVGVIRIDTPADLILSSVNDRTGLGSTGEIILARYDDAGNGIILTPLRFDDGAALQRTVPIEESNNAVVLALTNRDGFYREKNVVDYREEKVALAVRSIDNLDWVLIAKIDNSELLVPVTDLGIRYFYLISSILVAVVTMALWSSQTIVGPILSLTDSVKSLQSGNLSARATVKRKDEIGGFAIAFNDMAERLQGLYGELEKKVRDRTQDLSKFQQVVESATEGVIFTDPSGNITYVNEAWAKLNGYSANEVVGKNSRIVNSKKTDEEVFLRMWSSLTRKKPFFTEDVINKRKNGSHYQAQLSVFPIVEGEKVVFYVGLVSDISKRKEVESAKNEFVSLASHQLRTPLASINWYTETLINEEAGKLTRTQKEYLGEIYSGNQRMVDLVNALLDVSRIELGAFTIDSHPIGVSEIVDKIVEEQKEEVKKKKIKLTKKYDENIPLIPLDRKLFSIIVQNLISNAVKYTDKKGKVNIGIDFDKSKKNVVFSVSDTGVGIPQSQQDEVFSKLFRADNVQVLDTLGTGLGLYIVKSIIDHSNGKIWFKSKEGKGSTFCVSIPITGMKKIESKEGVNGK